MSRGGNPRSSRRKRKGDETQNPLPTTVPVPAPLDPIKQGWSRLAWQCVREVVYVQISKKKGAGPAPLASPPPPPNRQQKQGGAAILLHPSCMAVGGWAGGGG